jgi:hypothetical protein
LLLCCGRQAAAQVNPPQNRFSTHDWTLPTFGGPVPEPIIGTNDFREFWADVKVPGDGSAYSVGTIEVRTTVGALFSNSQALPATGLPAFTIAGLLTPARQVVMLQQANPNTNGLGWQRFYHGTNPGGVLRATNGRAVSVWPAATAADTRIAICGESRDQSLPLSNVGPAGWPGAGGQGSAGFVAMFDGNGTLLWSHHFFGVAADQHCAITDVSVRVEFVNGVPTTDFVTFCGVSTYGMPAANATLTAVLPFGAPLLTCASSAGGATNNGAGQWDGVVGRLTRAHAGAGPATTQFLSSFGGAQQDGLFGIADVDSERFVVVGSTTDQGGVPAGVDVPVTFGTCPATGVAPYTSGVAAVFRAIPGSALQVETSQLIGSAAVGTNTAARDVLLPRSWGSGGQVGIVVVGATDDGALFGAPSVGVPASPQGTIGGGVDGFILAGVHVPGSGAPGTGLLAWTDGTFRGDFGDESLTGVNGWNEFYDHLVVTGSSASGDIDVASFYRNVGTGLVQLSGGAVPAPLGGATIGGSAFDRPAAVAVAANGPQMFNATTAGGFSESGLGNPAGGGIAVDNTGRAHVVGTTISANFPLVAGGRIKTGITHDAVRIALDMLPPNVGRTDGTASLPLPPGTPAYPLAGFFGGTTPQCALTAFGHQIGLTDPQVAPAVPRMFIDWDGLAPAAGVNGFVVASRPPLSSAINLSAVQFGFPGTSGGVVVGPFPLLPDGVLLWTTDPSALVFTQPIVGGQVLQFPVPTLPVPPPGGITFTVQIVCLIVPVAGGAFGPVCPVGGQSSLVASPAMWLNW